MASLAKESDRGYVCWRLRFFLRDSRKSLRLGKISKRAAEEIKRHVCELIRASETGIPPSVDTVKWAMTVDPKIQKQLVQWELCDPVSPKIQTDAGRLLAAYLDKYIEERTDFRPNSVVNYKQTRRVLVEYFGADMPIRAITAADADRWRQWLTEQSPQKRKQPEGEPPLKLAAATVSKHVKRAKTMFVRAVEDRLMMESPFAKLKGGTESNKSRFHFVDRETCTKILKACPNHDWKLIFALPRFAGLRCPTEVTALKWSDIDWELGRIRIASTKTGLRFCPLFGELRPYLEEAKQAAPKNSVYCIQHYRGPDVNLGTQMKRITKSANVQPWPKTFVNLRSSCRTELQDRHPSHVINEWLGHSSEVAALHYLQVTDTHWQNALVPAPITVPATTSQR